MITVTPGAAKQIQNSAKESGIQDPVLRIAIKTIEDGSFHYAMGFDDAISESDLRFEQEGVKLVIAESSQPLAKGMTLDYVKLDDSENMNFIFINPNEGNNTSVDSD